MRFALGAVVVMVALAVASPASATQRYASPTGTGTACTQSEACNLSQATGKAKSGDEVIVDSGVYSLGATSLGTPSATNLTIHGDPSGPRPQIVLSTGTPVIGISEGRIEYLEFANTAPHASGVTCHSGSTLDRVRIEVSGEEAQALRTPEDACTFENSIALASGPEAFGVYSNPESPPASEAVVRNSLVIASGAESVGIASSYFGTIGSSSVDVENTIVQGDARDLAATTVEGPGNIRVSHSNFDQAKAFGGAVISDGGGNQSAAPLYVDAAHGDYREAAGSPTIDAGIAGPLLGGLDFDGGPRLLGAAPDIGPYEFVPPPPAPGKITSLQLSPKAFGAANVGGPILSRKKSVGKIAAAVTYSLSAASTVSFTVERKAVGRRVGKKCAPKTGGNAGHKKCPLYKPLKGAFTDDGSSGPNSFRFSGRIGGKPLKAGAYRLLGSAGGATKTAPFTVVR